MVWKFVKERIGSIILLVIVLVMVIWGYVSIQAAKGNTKISSAEYVAPEKTANLDAAGTYVSVAKNDEVELFYDAANGSIQLKNLRNGHVWKSIVDNDVYDMESLNKRWSSYMKSAITISYSNIDQRDATYPPMYSGRDVTILETEYLDNGVSVTYGFGSIGIYLTVEYLVDEDGFLVRIPMDKVREDTVYLLTSIEVLPFLGAAGDEVDGYMVYPDGSGAITSYANVGERPSNVVAGIYRVYSDKKMDYVSLLWDDDNRNRYSAALPIIGIKNNNDAILGAITVGAENSGMAVYPSGNSNISLNHIGFEIYTRNTFTIGISSVSGVTNTGTVQRVDKNLEMEDREIRYFLLDGDQANYSGMANVYKQYLLKTGQLVDVIAEGEQMPLAIESVMGIIKGGLLFDEYVTMTSFDDVVDILEQLKNHGITNTELVLTDWIKGGLESVPDYWPPASQLGGKGGVGTINEYAKANPGSHIYLENQFTMASSEGGGFSEVDDVAYDGLNITMSAEAYEGTEYYLLNPQVSYDRNEKFLDKIKKYDSLGVGYYYLGSVVYADYNEKYPFTKTAAAGKIKELLKSTQDNGRRIAVDGMNQYVYATADYLYHVREGSYGLSIMDSSIPFVQMVLSGMIPYSTENAGNLTYDLQTQKLKWIEYGAVPYFLLTKEAAINFRESDYDSIFSSTYSEWEERVVEVYKDMHENLQCVYGKQMTSHDILETNFVRVGYENGVFIYINYNNMEKTADGVSVPANSYVVVGGVE